MRASNTILILGLAFLLGACGAQQSSDQPRASAGSPGPGVGDVGKPTAPVEVGSVRLDASGARIRVAFPAGTVGGSVHVYGVDGLQVTSEADPIVARDFPDGGKLDIDVTYLPAAQRSYLAVQAGGTFDGRASSRVVSFEVAGTAPGASREVRALGTDPATGERVNLGGPIAPDR